MTPSDQSAGKSLKRQETVRAVALPDGCPGDAKPFNLTSETRQTRWRNQHPSRYRAHLAVQQAINSGSLVKQPCEVCGRSDQETRIDAHHDDYSEPLAVRWLCRLHHVRHHSGGTDLFTRNGAA